MSLNLLKESSFHFSLFSLTSFKRSDKSDNHSTLGFEAKRLSTSFIRVSKTASSHFIKDLDNHLSRIFEGDSAHSADSQSFKILSILSSFLSLVSFISSISLINFCKLLSDFIDSLFFKLS